MLEDPGTVETGHQEVDRVQVDAVLEHEDLHPLGRALADRLRGPLRDGGAERVVGHAQTL